MTPARSRSGAFLGFVAILQIAVACKGGLQPASDQEAGTGGRPSADAALPRPDASAPSHDARSGDDATTPFDAGVVCDPLPPPPVGLPPAGFASGSRLVLRMLAESAPGGLAVPADVFDSVLGLPCVPLRLADGTIRCVGGSGTTRYYGDPALTQPVVVIPVASAPPAGTPLVMYPAGVANDPYSGCSSEWYVGALGAQRSSQTYYGPKGDAYSAVATIGVFDVDPLAPELPTLTEVRTSLAGDIAVRELHATDGAKLFAQSLYDTRHDSPCSVNAGRCLPPTERRAFHWLPPASLSELNATPSWCDTPDGIFGVFGCAPVTFVYDGTSTSRVSQPVTATVYGCARDPLNPDLPVQNLTTFTGPVLAECASVPVTDWTDVVPVTLGSGRLTTQAISIGGATFIPPMPVRAPTVDGVRTFADTSLGISCSAGISDNDGLLRCYPRGALRAAYLDAACTQPVALGAPAPPSPPAYATEVTLDAQRRVRGVFAVGAKIGTGHTFYGVTQFAGQPPSSCGMFIDGGVTVYAASPVPEDTFASMELQNVAP